MFKGNSRVGDFPLAAITHTHTHDRTREAKQDQRQKNTEHAQVSDGGNQRCGCLLTTRSKQRETTGWSSKHPGSLLLQNDIMRFGCLLQKTAAAYPIKWVKTTWKLYAVNDGTWRFWTRQAIWPVGFVWKSKSRIEKHQQGHKVKVKVKTVTQSRSKSPQQQARLQFTYGLKGCWKSTWCLLCGRI